MASAAARARQEQGQGEATRRGRHGIPWQGLHY